MMRRSMSFGDAVDLYGRLTIGDGLVTMIPALLISTAAGLLVTRVGEGEKDMRLGERLGSQLFAEPVAIISSALILVLLAFVPGLPAWPFVTGGALLLLGSILAFVKKKTIIIRAKNADEINRVPQVLLHELVHIYLGIISPEESIPTWLHEGVSQLLRRMRDWSENRFPTRLSLSLPLLPVLSMELT